MSTAKSKALKKYENSKVDEYLDRETKVKEGSKKDKRMDKHISKLLTKY